MTLREKITRYMVEMRGQDSGGLFAAPPLTRVLWKLNVDVPPPFLRRYASLAIGSGSFFTVWMFCCNMLLLHVAWQRQLGGALIGGAFFGIAWAAYVRHRGSKLRLSPWNSDGTSRV